MIVARISTARMEEGRGGVLLRERNDIRAGRCVFAREGRGWRLWTGLSDANDEELYVVFFLSTT